MKRLLILLLLAALTACGNSSTGSIVGTLERDRITLLAERAEPVVAVHVREGESVEENQLLLELDDRRSAAELARLKALREQARHRLDELQRGPRREEIDAARAALRRAGSLRANAARELERITSLHQQALASEAALDAARTSHDSATQNEASARAALEALLNGTTAEELEQAAASLRAAEAAVQAQELSHSRLKIRAPRAGIVESLPFKHGAEPQAGAIVAVLLARSPLYARVHVPASRRAEFAPGTEVIVAAPGYGEHRGRVRWVSGEAAFTPHYALTEHDRDHLSYAAEILLENEELPAGIPVEVRLP